MKRKLVAVLACRNGGSRLYAKPLQNLDEKKKINIISFLIDNIKKLKDVSEVALAISNKRENLQFIDIAKKRSIKYIIGDDVDVLSRLTTCARILKASDVLRITSESPFPYLENFSYHWKNHIKNDYDATFLDNIVDGCGFEIIKTSALIESVNKGSKRHKSELCTLFIRENNNKFNINRIFPKKIYFRKDLRLTVDNPEDLIVCKKVYSFFKNKKISLKKIINFIDKNSYLKELIKPYCKNGYSKMYNWGKRKK